jgi:hypothetical protein
MIIPILTILISFQVNKNAMLCKSIDELFQKGGGGGEVGADASQQHAALEGMEKRV